MYLLEGRQAPDHSAIARFRSEHFGKCAEPVSVANGSYAVGIGADYDNGSLH